MKVFVVSVEHESSRRWQNFVNQPFIYAIRNDLVKIGIKGSELSAKEYFDKVVKGRSKPLTPGELGCTLSHLHAYKKFLESDDDYALILEDDAIFPEKFTFDQLNTEFLKLKLMSNFIFSLGGIQMKECRKIRGKFNNTDFLFKRILKVIPDFFHRINYAYSYIIDRAMAENLIKYHVEIRRADDWSFLCDHDKASKIFMTFLVDHPIVTHDNINGSLLEDERSTSYDISKSIYGNFFNKNLAKIFSSEGF